MVKNRWIPNGILLAAVITTPARLASAPPDAADQLLGVIPPHASAALVIHDLRRHHSVLQQPSLAARIASSPGVKRITDSQEFRKILTIADYLCKQASTTPQEVLDQVIGDAIVFAVLPAEGNNADKEHSLLLIRPARDELVGRLVDRLNEIQLKSGEVSQLLQRRHQKQTYFQRRKATGELEFYLRGPGVFAFSTSEQAIQGVLDHLAKDATERRKTPLQAARQALGLESALAALLINPRALDREIEAKRASSPPAERAFLNWFFEQWKKLDAVAAYLKLNDELEIGLAISPLEGKWLLHPSHQSDLWSVIPTDAFFAAAGKHKLTDVLSSLSPLLPEDGRQSLRNLSEQFLNPLFGKDKLPMVLDSIGPNWALWVEAPSADEWPASVLALEIRSPPQAEAPKMITQGLLYLFQTIRVIHNARGMEQISLIEKDFPNVQIHSLTGEGVFPQGVQPSYAVKEGYLILATHPAPIQRFQRPAPASPPAKPEVRMARLSVTELQKTLTQHGPGILRILSPSDDQPPRTDLLTIQYVMDWLRVFQSVELILRSDGPALHVCVKLSPGKPQNPEAQGHNP